MDLVHQHDAAPACLHGGDDVVDEVLAVGLVDATDFGLVRIDAAGLVEGPVAAVDMPADDPVAALLQVRIGLAAGIAIGVAEQLGRLQCGQSGVAALDLAGLPGGRDVMEIGMRPGVVADQRAGVCLHECCELGVTLGLGRDQEKAGRDLVLVQQGQDGLGGAGLRAVIEAQADEPRGRWRRNVGLESAALPQCFGGLVHLLGQAAHPRRADVNTVAAVRVFRGAGGSGRCGGGSRCDRLGCSLTESGSEAAAEEQSGGRFHGGDSQGQSGRRWWTGASQAPSAVTVRSSRCVAPEASRISSVVQRVP
mmetsp:Transcript_25824/g.46902  ORF Transcript_25824/g.46902 Transcript_25824/m.46902 type:complete len:308 (+) Transcript_25824:553-1476(+)